MRQNRNADKSGPDRLAQADARPHRAIPGAGDAAPNLRQVPAVTRAIAILRLLAASQIRLGLIQIARTEGILPSTCLNILRVLVSEELVAFNAATKRYSLDAGMLALTRPLLRPDSPGHRVQPHLDRIAREFKVTAALVEVIGLKHFIVIAVSRTEGLRLQIDVGRRAPALISATGRCVAAFGNHPVESLKLPFALLRWDNAPTFKGWLREVELTRRRGYGVDEDNYISGMTTIAAPVPANGHPMKFCLTAVGMTDQIRRSGRQAIAKALVSIAQSTFASN